MLTGLRRSRSSERGSMAIEVVIFAPILVGVMLLVVAFGRYVDREADVQAIARDAARAATLERTYGEAVGAANAVVNAAEARLYDGARCLPVGGFGPGDFVAGATITVTVTCELRWRGLAPIGLDGTVTFEADAQSPLDQWRRTG